ncbi:gamma-aminobutyrate permease [Sinomonas cyclohexanicum]|uniref:Gamma-aminobutyrate permease n=1 Tax=Sinomonas cyclohexanicum TaxID=322009 RepID=A0ABN6FLT3_SINCY|nr:amino acid permease [Corynebacterium cyclohexanicum]BCT77790.1 gamma-aminobutyrate permease [Corynebacterium cyclohexanicum]
MQAPDRLAAPTRQDPAGGTAAQLTADRTTESAPSARLRPRHLTMIALGGIIGASLFVGSGSVIRTVGPAALFSYAIGGALVVLVMRMLGEMSTNRPVVGSFMEYARDGLGNWAGFTIGWLYWYFWVGVVAFEAVVVGRIFHEWFPSVPDWTFALAGMLVFTFTNLMSLRSFGETEFWLASIKVTTIVVFLGVGTLYVLGVIPGSTGSISNITDHGFMPHGWTAVFNGVAVVIFSYFGTEIVTMAAAESDQPAKGVAKATNTVVWRILLFYVGSVAILLMVVPWDELPAKVSPFAFAFGRFGLPGAEQVMNAVVLTAALSVLNSGLYSGSRMLFALSRHGYAPRWVEDRNRAGVPWKAILLSTVVGYVAIAANYVAPKDVFDFIMNSAGCVALFVYAFVAVTQWRLRNRMSAQERAGLTLKMWLHPWLNAVVLAAVGLIVVLMAFDPDAAPQVWLSLGALALLLAVYPFVRRRATARATRDGGAAVGGTADGDAAHDGEPSPSAAQLT